MTAEVLNAILAEVQPIFDEKKFENKGEYYANDQYAVKFEHDQNNKVLKLFVAPVTDGEVQEYQNLSTYLFEDETYLKDATCAGLDFADTIRTKCGYKRNTRQITGTIAIPKGKSDGNNIDTYTGKILAVYPEHKQDYQDHIAKYGKFLYVDFYASVIAPTVKKVFESGAKKQISKIVDVLDEMYCKGDKICGDIAVGIILCGAADFDTQKAESIKAALEDRKYLKTAFSSYFELSLKSPKVKEMLKK